MFGYGFLEPVTCHRYYLFSTGTSLKPKYYNSRAEANHTMYAYCVKHGIQVDCVEDCKHEKAYSDHHGVNFYINRV